MDDSNSDKGISQIVEDKSGMGKQGKEEREQEG